MAARGSGDGGLRIARMQRSREAARRFDSAFAVDIAQTAASELVIPRAEFGPDAAPSGEAPQPGAVSSNAGSFAPAEVNDSSVAANAPASPGAGIPAPDAGPGAELPALDADSAGGPSPG
jgi:hypothetical protein